MENQLFSTNWKDAHERSSSGWQFGKRADGTPLGMPAEAVPDELALKCHLLPLVENYIGSWLMDFSSFSLLSAHMCMYSHGCSLVWLSSVLQVGKWELKCPALCISVYRDGGLWWQQYPEKPIHRLVGVGGKRVRGCSPRSCATSVLIQKALDCFKSSIFLVAQHWNPFYKNEGTIIKSLLITVII